jgi:hypothetical protein
MAMMVAVWVTVRESSKSYWGSPAIGGVWQEGVQEYLGLGTGLTNSW